MCVVCRQHGRSHGPNSDTSEERVMDPSSEHTSATPETPVTEPGSASEGSATPTAEAAPATADVDVTPAADLADGPVNVPVAPSVSTRPKTKGVADIVFVIDVSG